MYDLIYQWGNNPKRATLKGKKCRLLATGKKGSIMIEFEDGQREITSHYAVRKGETNMPEDTPQRRNYRVDTPKREIAPKREVPVDETPAETRGSGDGKSSFVNVTGLFRSKSGKADTVFVTEEIIDKFASMAVGDVLGVSENVNNGNLQIWYIVKKED